MGQLSGIKIAAPQYDDIVPSTKTKVKLTPFRVGDEKVLLIASQSKDTKQMVVALKNVIKNCVEPIDCNKLAPFDLEYLFVKLRALSVGENTTVGIKCDSCEDVNRVEIDLSSVKVSENKDHSNIVKISDNLTFEMKYIDLENIDPNFSAEDVETVFDLVARSISKVYYGDDIIEIGEADIKDMKGILNDLSSKQFNIVQEFFNTAPKLRHNVDFKCKKCEKDNKQTLEGFASFFT